MADDAVELTRFTDAAAARQAMRTLLAAGCAASTRRAGDEHVLEVPRDELAEAARHLDLPVPVAGLVPAPAVASSDEPGSGTDVDVDVDADADAEGEDAGEGDGGGDGGELEPEPAPVLESSPPESLAPEPEPAVVVDSARPATPGPDGAVESIFGVGPVPAVPDTGGSALPPPPSAPPSVPQADAPVEADASPIEKPDVDADGYAIIAMVAGEEEGHGVAAVLLEHGIGVDLVDADAAGYGRPPGSSGPSTEGALLVRVLPSDVAHARALAERPLPRRTRYVEGTTPTVIDGEEVRGYFGGRLNVTRTQLTLIILAYVAALILIPLFFFWGTQQLLDPGIDDPKPTLPGPGVTSP